MDLPKTEHAQTDDSEKARIIKIAVKVIESDIDAVTFQKDVYPSSN